MKLSKYQVHVGSRVIEIDPLTERHEVVGRLSQRTDGKQWVKHSDGSWHREPIEETADARNTD